jgi:hypothetical protein
MEQRTLTMRGQLDAMRRDWPQLRVRHYNARERLAHWVGQVRPQFTSYTVDIRYCPEFQFPHVRVVVPKLLRQPCNGEGQLPHVYPPAEDPILCLFDPRGGEWDHTMLISQTIVPWTLDWLSCYEFWAISGTWRGGGRHAGPFEPISNDSRTAA